MTKIATGAMHRSASLNSDPNQSFYRSRWQDGPSVEETTEDEDGLDLPVDPDEGMPLIPDDERVIDVPS